MSFILDALKKSENDRQQQAPAEFATVPSSPDSAAAPRWLWILGILLAINVVILVGITLRSSTTPSLPMLTEQVRSAPEPQTAAQAVPEAQVSQPIAFQDQLEEARRNLPERPTANAGTKLVSAISDNESRSAVIASTGNSGSANMNQNQNFALLPSLTELRINGALQLPDLHVDIHVYSENPSDRFVFINMNKYRESDQLGEGPVVLEITRDGVILDHRGTAFSLPRE